MKAYIGRIKLILIGLGVLFAVASLFEFDGLAQQALWSEEEAKQLSEVSTELKNLHYKRPGASGLTAEEIAQQKQRVQERFEALHARSQRASKAPGRWQNMLLAAAVICLCGGLGCHFADSPD